MTLRMWALRSAFALIVLVAVFIRVAPCSAEEGQAEIRADSLVYRSEEKIYELTGNVLINRAGASVQADRIIYRELTGDVLAEGSVRLEDKDVLIVAQRAEMNVETKTGQLFAGEVLYKSDNYRVKGAVLERRGEERFFSPEASFTTCDGPVPAWCFKGRDIDVLLGDRLKAQDVTFRIKDLPVLYAPHLWAPIMTERKTGFLMPTISQSDKRGFGLKIPFYWVIAGNSDATIVLDWHSKRGLGTGLEYRSVMPGGRSGTWWLYHIRDRVLDTDYFELKARHEGRQAGQAGWFANINYVNEKDFYREYGERLSVSAQRFLESTAEISLPFRNGRTYLLGQYWVDLKHDTADVPQRLPEAGLVLNYARTGPFLVTMNASATHFWRQNGPSAYRFDLYPKIFLSVGRDLVFSQSLAARATGYSFYRNEGMDDSMFRAAAEYEATLGMKLIRRYASFTHVIEPQLRYHGVANSENDVPVLDVDELFRKTSSIGLGVLNRIIVEGREVATVRIAQEMETTLGDRPFLPLRIDVGVHTFLPLKIEATYDVHTGRIETIGSEIGFAYGTSRFSVGQRYNRSEDVMLFTASIGLSPYKGIDLGASIAYDAKGQGMRELVLAARYSQQCWAVRAEAAKRPDDFSFHVFFELAGINAKPPSPARE